MLRWRELLLMMFVLLLFATCFLAYSNGANDNFKGVASLFGSRTCGYRVALSWATITTFAGSIMSLDIHITLPCAAILAGSAYWLTNSLFA